MSLLDISSEKYEESKVVTINRIQSIGNNDRTYMNEGQFVGIGTDTVLFKERMITGVAGDYELNMPSLQRRIRERCPQK